MPEYRAHKVEVEGRLVGADPLVCEDNSEAIAAAQKRWNARNSGAAVDHHTVAEGQRGKIFMSGNGHS